MHKFCLPLGHISVRDVSADWLGVGFEDSALSPGAGTKHWKEGETIGLGRNEALWLD